MKDFKLQDSVSEGFCEDTIIEEINVINNMVKVMLRLGKVRLRLSYDDRANNRNNKDSGHKDNRILSRKTII
jgi:hypothetical protein